MHVHINKKKGNTDMLNTSDEKIMNYLGGGWIAVFKYISSNQAID
jgi:hypothetical protein